MSVLAALGWASAIFVAYTYLGYPLVIWTLGWLSPKRVCRTGRIEQSFSIVVIAHNEEQHIQRRLRELRELVAGGRRADSIILVSDGSTDATAALAGSLERITVIELPVRRGKAMAMNVGATASGADVLLFGDARQRWAADAAERLLENFDDPQVGGVSGDLWLEPGTNGTIRGFGLYWRFEKWLRRRESLFDSCVGVTGAICGVRRTLFPVLPEGTVLDDVYWPMAVVMQGFRVVHDRRAVAYDSSPPRVIGEFWRKVRTLAGNYQLLRLRPDLLAPWRNPLWLQFVSHKISRLAIPWMMLTILLLTGQLFSGPYQQAAFVTQFLCYSYACLGLTRWGRLLPLGGAAASFLVVNVAAFAAFWIWQVRGTAYLWRQVCTLPAAVSCRPPRVSEITNSDGPGVADYMDAIRPIARRLIFRSFVPGGGTRPVFALLYALFWYGREIFEWVRRTCVATPVFLVRCESHGTDVSVDRIPYMTGRCQIDVGSQVRISGKIAIESTSKARSRLRIGNGVFIGHGCSLGMASHIDIGDFVSIGGQTFITDTEGHAAYNPRRAIWEVPATADDTAPVVIEDNVQIGRYCVILKGVRIGARSIVGTGSVLRSSVPPDSLVMGNPARVVKRLTAGD